MACRMQFQGIGKGKKAPEHCHPKFGFAANLNLMNLAERLAQVRDEMAAACTRAGRPENAVRLMAVTKTQPVERVREALELGIDLLGENRVQEAEAKIPGLGAYGAEWHLIGPLQAN